MWGLTGRNGSWARRQAKKGATSELLCWTVCWNKLRRSTHENIQGRYVLIIMIFAVPWSFYVVRLLHNTLFSHSLWIYKMYRQYDWHWGQILIVTTFVEDTFSVHGQTSFLKLYSLTYIQRIRRITDFHIFTSTHKQILLESYKHSMVFDFVGRPL